MKDIAFYYPGHIWYDTEHIKSMLLFFDGVGMLIPEYKRGEPERLDPVLAGPLRELDLLHYFVADEIIDSKTTERLVDIMAQVIESGALEPLMHENTAFHSLSMSRLGFSGNEKLARELFEKLREMNLAKDSEDGSSIPMHPTVRYLVLVLLAQMLREPLRETGCEAAPITDRPRIVEALAELLRLPGSPVIGRVVEFDLQAVAPNLSAVPLDEVLDFRNQYKEEHKRYMHGLRTYARQISLLPVDEQDRALADRQEELDQYAAEIKRLSRKEWRKAATIGLGLAGAAWQAASNDAVTALLSLGVAVMSAAAFDGRRIDAFSYLMSANRRFV